MKKFLMLYIALFSVFLLGCTKHDNFPDEVSKVSISGAAVDTFFDDVNNQNTEEVIWLEEPQEVKAFMTAVKRAEFHTGPMTDEGSNLLFSIYYENIRHDSFEFWLRPEMKTGKFKNEKQETFFLKEKDVLTIVELLRKQAEKN
jgi:hypothetical protein